MLTNANIYETKDIPEEKRKAIYNIKIKSN